MSDQLKRAELIPYDSTGNTLEAAKAIALDFNPETLSLTVSQGQEMDASRQGRQQKQNVGNSNATLSFEAIFDTTRPKGVAGQNGDTAATPEKLDVRLKTSRIANLLQLEEKGKKPAPRRVQFAWGTIIFDGLITSFSETLDYFSPGGVPLRSKVSISITEQHFRYTVSAEDAAAAAKAPTTLNDAGAVAAANDSDSLFDVLAGSGFNFDASLDLGVALEAQVSLGLEGDLGVELGLDIDLAANAGAGIELSVTAAVEVFGDAVLGAAFGADVDLGLAAKGAAGVPSPGGQAGAPSNPWAPEGPTPGTRAAELAARVSEARVSAGAGAGSSPPGGAFSATALTSRPRAAAAEGIAARAERPIGQIVPADERVGVKPRPPVTPLPVRGSPPLMQPRFGPPPPDGVYSGKRRRRPELVVGDRGRPSWERLPADAQLAAPRDRSEPARPVCGGLLRRRTQAW